ncbi:MAG TPA: response regulator, partial [Syntrophorhabdaceae bacterium]
MSDNLDVIIIDDEPEVCKVITDIVETFYSWGNVISFTSTRDALAYLASRKPGVAIFILDVFLGNETCFEILESIVGKYPMAYEDAIIVTGNASSEVVDMCIASNITYLIEKPIRPYTLQLSVRAIVSKYIRFARRLLQDP